MRGAHRRPVLHGGALTERSMQGRNESRRKDSECGQPSLEPDRPRRRGCVGQGDAVLSKQTNARVSNRCAEVDQRCISDLGGVVRHREGSRLQFERGRDAVHQLEVLAQGRWGMGMQIDESGCDDEARSVDPTIAGEGRLGYSDDPVAADSQVPNAVQARLWIHHPAMIDHQRVVVGNGRAREKAEKQADRSCAANHRQRLGQAHGVIPTGDGIGYGRPLVLPDGKGRDARPSRHSRPRMERKMARRLCQLKDGSPV